jgi:hypothetical protein
MDGTSWVWERWAFDERVLGSSAFIARLLADAAPSPTPVCAPVDAAQCVAQVLSRVARRLDLQIPEITTTSRRRIVVEARALVSYAAVRNAGLPARQVAPLLGVRPRTVLKGAWLAQRRFASRVLQAPELHPHRHHPV